MSLIQRSAIINFDTRTHTNRKKIYKIFLYNNLTNCSYKPSKEAKIDFQQEGCLLYFLHKYIMLFSILMFPFVEK